MLQHALVVVQLNDIEDPEPTSKFNNHLRACGWEPFRAFEGCWQMEAPDNTERVKVIIRDTLASASQLANHLAYQAIFQVGTKAAEQLIEG